MYAKVKDGKLVKYPYWVNDLQDDFPNTSFPISLEGVDLSDFSAVHVKQVQAPVAPEGSVVEEVEPKLVNTEWVQQWVVKPL